MRKDWSFTKHFFAFAFALVVLDVILKSILPNKSGMSIGIIGGVDGPTALFLSSKLIENIWMDVLFIGIFIVILILYRPIKNYIERK